MVQDVFLERIVPRKMRGADLGLQFLLSVAAVALAFVAGFVLGAYAPLAVLAVAYGWWRLVQNFYVEYEYILTNGELDVDRIVAKRRRKRMLTVDTRGFEALARWGGRQDGEFLRYKDNAQLLDFASSAKSDGIYYAVFTPKNGKRTLMFFEPDGRMLEAIGKLIPRKVRL